MKYFIFVLLIFLIFFIFYVCRSGQKSNYEILQSFNKGNKKNAVITLLDTNQGRSPISLSTSQRSQRLNMKSTTSPQFYSDPIHQNSIWMPGVINNETTYHPYNGNGRMSAYIPQHNNHIYHLTKEISGSLFDNHNVAKSLYKAHHIKLPEDNSLGALGAAEPRQENEFQEKPILLNIGNSKENFVTPYHIHDYKKLLINNRYNHGVPFQQGQLKWTSERYGTPFYYNKKPLISHDYFKPYGINPNLNSEIVVADKPFYDNNNIEQFPKTKGGLYSNTFLENYRRENRSQRYNPHNSYKPYIYNHHTNLVSDLTSNLKQHPNHYVNNYNHYHNAQSMNFVPFYNPHSNYFSSVNSFFPQPSLTNNIRWEKYGIVTSLDKDDKIMNLYRRPIAPLQDLFEYSVQNKDGFVIPLRDQYLENGDIIENIPGIRGKWKVHDFVKNKYVYM